MCRLVASIPGLAALLMLTAIALAGDVPQGKKPPAPKPEPLTLRLEGATKEVRLRDWRCTTGTRRLAWLGDPPPPPARGKKSVIRPTGPEALEFREERSTLYQNGIVTLVPLTALKQIAYDPAAKSVAATLLTAGGKEQTLTGTTKFTGINKLALDGDADLGELGNAPLRFIGGNGKGLRVVRFPTPQPAPEAKGRAVTIVAEDKEKTAHAIVDPQALYVIEGQQRAVPYLIFKGGMKVELDKLTALSRIAPKTKKVLSTEFTLTTQGGEPQTRTLLTKVDLDGRPAQLLGLLGRVPAGWKLFPPHTIATLRGETPKAKAER